MELNWNKYTPGENTMTITTLDTHTAGEPLRIVTGGMPDLPGSTILARRRYMQERYDHIRKALMWEPRGHYNMYGRDTPALRLLRSPRSGYVDCVAMLPVPSRGVDRDSDAQYLNGEAQLVKGCCLEIVRTGQNWADSLGPCLEPGKLNFNRYPPCTIARDTAEKAFSLTPLRLEAAQPLG